MKEYLDFVFRRTKTYQIKGCVQLFWQLAYIADSRKAIYRETLPLTVNFSILFLETGYTRELWLHV